MHIFPFTCLAIDPSRFFWLLSLADRWLPLLRGKLYIFDFGSCPCTSLFFTQKSLHRKSKASDATKILINLFVAMFTLNLSFLINESIANLGNFGACVAMAATMHYTMLATFTWFFMEAIHLYFNLWKLPTEIKHYLTKIYVAGWGKKTET